MNHLISYVNSLKGKFIQRTTYSNEAGLVYNSPIDQNDQPDLRLMDYAESGNLLLVRECLQNGENPNIKNSQGESALMVASRKGYVQIVDVLLNGKADVNLRCNKGWTAFLYSVIGQNICILNKLVLVGANKNQTDNNGQSALMIAVQRGCAEVANELLRIGIDANIKDQRGLTALAYAKCYRNATMCEMIQGRGVTDDSDYNTGFEEDIVRFLEHMNFGDNQAFITACREGNPHIVSSIVESSGDKSIVNIKGPDDITPLMVASIHGHYPLVQYLLNNRADVNAKDIFGRNALALAVECNHSLIAEVLAKSSSEVNVTYREGMTPLLIASSSGSTKSVQVLIDNGAAVNHQCSSGRTALMLASQGGYIDIVKTLTKRGADVNLSDKNGFTASDIAEEKRNIHIGIWLEKCKTVDYTEESNMARCLSIGSEDKREIVNLEDDIFMVDAYNALKSVIRKKPPHFIKAASRDREFKVLYLRIHKGMTIEARQFISTTQLSIEQIETIQYIEEEEGEGGLLDLAVVIPEYAPPNVSKIIQSGSAFIYVDGAPCMPKQATLGSLMYQQNGCPEDVIAVTVGHAFLPDERHIHTPRVIKDKYILSSYSIQNQGEAVMDKTCKIGGNKIHAAMEEVGDGTDAHFMDIAAFPASKELMEEHHPRIYADDPYKSVYYLGDNFTAKSVSKVFKVGGFSGFKMGEVIETDYTWNRKYKNAEGDSENRPYTGLFVVRGVSGENFSIYGDSGSLVYDGFGRVIGIVFAVLLSGYFCIKLEKEIKGVCLCIRFDRCHEYLKQKFGYDLSFQMPEPQQALPGAGDILIQKEVDNNDAGQSENTAHEYQDDKNTSFRILQNRCFSFLQNNPLKKLRSMFTCRSSMVVLLLVAVIGVSCCMLYGYQHGDKLGKQIDNQDKPSLQENKRADHKTGKTNNKYAGLKEVNFGNISLGTLLINMLNVANEKSLLNAKLAEHRIEIEVLKKQIENEIHKKNLLKKNLSEHQSELEELRFTFNTHTAMHKLEIHHLQRSQYEAGIGEEPYHFYRNVKLEKEDTLNKARFMCELDRIKQLERDMSAADRIKQLESGMSAADRIKQLQKGMSAAKQGSFIGYIFYGWRSIQSWMVTSCSSDVYCYFGSTSATNALTIYQRSDQVIEKLKIYEGSTDLAVIESAKAEQSDASVSEHTNQESPSSSCISFEELKSGFINIITTIRSMTCSRIPNISEETVIVSIEYVLNNGNSLMQEVYALFCFWVVYISTLYCAVVAYTHGQLQAEEILDLGKKMDLNRNDLNKFVTNTQNTTRPEHVLMAYVTRHIRMQCQKLSCLQGKLNDEIDNRHKAESNLEEIKKELADYKGLLSKASNEKQIITNNLQEIEEQLAFYKATTQAESVETCPLVRLRVYSDTWSSTRAAERRDIWARSTGHLLRSSSGRPLSQ